MTEPTGPSHPQSAALFTDLYELTMAQSYLRQGMTAPAVFELHFRELPSNRNFILAAGLEPLLDTLEGLRFTDADMHYLRAQQSFSDAFLDHLADLRFTGDVWALPEGTVVFPHEPLVQVIAPLPQAQLVETLVLNQIHFAGIAASKAARIALAADGRRVIDFGSRRAHGTDAALTVARAAYLAGCDGTSLVDAGRRFAIPIYGTMAHSYIQAHDDETQAFENFLESFPESTLLVDTYDTLDGVRKVIDLVRRRGDTARPKAIRLDSGDLLELARQSRRLLDDAGLHPIQIFASGGLDEYKLHDFGAAQAPIDGYGVGTSLSVSADAPALDMAYKLVEYNGQPRTKLSSSKTIYPGRKQGYRHRSGKGFHHDVLAPVDHEHDGEPLLQHVMRDGHRIGPQAPLKSARDHARRQIQSLPDALRRLNHPNTPYPVEITQALQHELDELRQSHETP